LVGLVVARGIDVELFRPDRGVYNYNHKAKARKGAARNHFLGVA
jgi:hypothetical protein